MSEQQDHTEQPAAQAGGFLNETEPTPSELESQPNNSQKKTSEKPTKSAELKANFMSVFGHGFGKFALIAALVVVVLFSALAVRGFGDKSGLESQEAQVDVPSAPAAKVNVEPIDEREAQRRAEQAAKEAEAASRVGKTYQPDFNPAVVARSTQPTEARIGQPPLPASSAQSVPVTVQAGQSSANGGAGAQSGQQAQQQEELRRQQMEHEKQLAAREKYIQQLRGGVKEQVEELLGGRDNEGGLRGTGSYSIVSYLPRQQALGTSANPAIGTEASGKPIVNAGTPVPSNKPPIFKAGKTIFATLDSEVNTDDGGEVFATVRGGPFDGSKLIGKIEQAPRNIRLRFATLAPQDNRATLNINAIAIREEDAKQGVAESIDSHTLERYSALFAGSILSGISKAAMQPQGNTIVLPNGQVIVSQPELSDKRIAMLALGEVGVSAAAEIRKTFNQPPTYKTPAQKGIGVIFLTDVNEK
jgi:intracellular multiplication protein IcmE